MTTSRRILPSTPTICAQLAEQVDRSALVRGDDFFAFLRRGATAPWLPESHEQNTAVVEAAAQAAGRLARYCEVVYDGVVGPWFASTFLDSAGIEQMHYVVLLPPLHTCLRRVSVRSGHGFTDLGAAEHMWHEFNDAGVDPSHVIRHEGPPPELSHAIRAIVNSGGARYRAPT